MFQIIIKPKAEKEFVKLPVNLKQDFFSEFKKLAVSPFQQSVKKIKGTEFGYRIRIGRRRVLFALFLKEKRIEIVDIFMEKNKSDYARKRKLLN